jgi:hypothetical protein
MNNRAAITRSADSARGDQVSSFDMALAPLKRLKRSRSWTFLSR